MKRSIPIILLVVLGRRTHAQTSLTTERGDSLFRTGCENALVISQAVVTTGKQDARDFLAACEVSGPSEIARLWSTTIPADGDLPALIRGSRYIHDTRILDTLRVVIATESRPDTVRIAAMDVLSSYGLPGLAFPPLRYDGDRYTLQSSSEPVIGGDVPFSANSASDALAAISSAAATVVSPVVRQHAARLYGALDSYLASIADRPDPSKIQLVYVCANKFRITNSGTRAIVLNYDVIGTSITNIEVTILLQAQEELHPA